MTLIVDPCPTGCGRTVSFGKLMCRLCWAKVPADLQRRVYDTWGTYRSLIGSARRAGKSAAREAYIEARDAAIEAALR